MTNTSSSGLLASPQPPRRILSSCRNNWHWRPSPECVLMFLPHTVCICGWVLAGWQKYSVSHVLNHRAAAKGGWMGWSQITQLVQFHLLGASWSLGCCYFPHREETERRGGLRFPVGSSLPLLPRPAYDRVVRKIFCQLAIACDPSHVLVFVCVLSHVELEANDKMDRLAKAACGVNLPHVPACHSLLPLL